MVIAIKFLDNALRMDYSYKHLLWVFSGQKGVHVWVSDTHAMKMDDKIRSAVVNVLSGLHKHGGREYPRWRLNVGEGATPLARKTAAMKPTFRYVVILLVFHLSHIPTEQATRSSKPTPRHSCLHSKDYSMEMVL